MQLPIELRLKVRHWTRKYGKILFFIFVAWTIIFLINKFLGDYKQEPVPNTTLEPKVSVMDSTKKVNDKVQTTAEEFIEEYVDNCNQGKYQKAFAMLSEDCKKYEFENSEENFASHVLDKMPTPKKYAIQNYSDYGGYYIYEVKYFDDLLATGLTNQKYLFTTEKMILSKNSKGEFEIAVGNFVEYRNINSVAENEFLKVDVKNCLVRYSTETYEIQFTNRSDNIVVISDNYQEDEVTIVLKGEYRGTESSNHTIVLGPEETKTVHLGFMKFFDDDDETQSIMLTAVRVLESYEGTGSSNATKEAEIAKAIDKFSMTIPVKKK